MSDFPISHLSWSSVALFSRCPACWKSSYLDRAPRRVSPALVVGSALHGGMAALRRGHDPETVVDAAKDEMGSSLMGIDRSGELPTTDPILDLGSKFSDWQAVEDEVDRLLPSLSAVVDSERGCEVQAVEVPVEFGATFTVPFTGYADVLLKDGDTLWIKDLKSSASASPPDASAWRQGAVYTLGLGTAHFAVDSLIKTKAVQVRTWRDEGQAAVISPELKASVRGQVEWVAAGIRRGDFPVGDGGTFGHDHPHPGPTFFSFALEPVA